MRDGKGPDGEVRVGYQVAAWFGPWRMTPRGVVGDPNPHGAFAVMAQHDREIHSYWLWTGGPFDLILTLYDGRRLRWRGVTVQEEMLCLRVVSDRSDPEEA